MWVVLRNQTRETLQGRLVARSQGAEASEPLVLPPGARRRVCLALVVREDRVLVELVDGATPDDGTRGKAPEGLVQGQES